MVAIHLSKSHSKESLNVVGGTLTCLLQGQIVLAASKLSMPVVRLIAEKDTAELNDDVEDFPVRINDLSLCLSIPIPLQIR